MRAAFLLECCFFRQQGRRSLYWAKKGAGRKGKRQRNFPENFFAAFPFAPLLSSPNISCASLAGGKNSIPAKKLPAYKAHSPMPERGLDGIFFVLAEENTGRGPSRAADTGIAATKKGILLQTTARPKDPPCSQLSRSLSCKAFQSSHHLFHVLDREVHRQGPVSYTHLDVYKRQGRDSVEIVTPFVQVGTYPTRNFATLGPL